MHSGAIKILLVEDNPGDARLVQMALSELPDRRFEIRHVERLNQALQLLGGHAFDAILLDLSLPDSHGLDTVTQIKAADPSVPIVVLSGLLDEELALEAVKVGAQDYLVKGQGDGYLVARSVRYAMERKHTESVLLKAREELELRVRERTAHLEDANSRLLQEIAQRTHAEGILRKERDFISALLDTLGAFVVVLDTNGCVVRFNRACEEGTGYSFAEVQGTPFWDILLVPEEIGAVKEVFRNLQTVKLPGTFENHWRTKAGELRLISWSNTVLMDEHGSVEYVIGTGIDITERRQSEAALRESEHQLRTITDALPVLVSYVDSSMRYRFNNKAYEDFLGRPRDELNGRNLREIIGDAAYDLVRPHVQAALNGRPVTFEAALPYEGAGERHVSVSYMPDFGDSGDVKGFFALVTDTTERKELEEREKQRMLQLAHVSRLSTMGEMATQIAHELNQPLAAIASYSDTCLRMTSSRSWEPGDLDEALTDIGNQAHRAGEIIRRLRSLARKDEPLRLPVDVNELVRETVYLANVEARWHDIEIQLNLEPDLPEVLADRILIEQVIMNLTRNGIDVMVGDEQSDRTLTIQTSVNQVGEIEVAVTDSGPGLSPDALEKVFEPFFTTKQTGMGMGLSISQTIIDAHRGRLWVKSTPGLGATFSFTLPAVALRGEHYAN
jgi:two-component system sensor kinase FixL